MTCECRDYQRPRWPPHPIMHGKNALSCRMGHGIKKMQEMSVLFFEYKKDFPAVGVTDTIYVAYREQKLCYYDKESKTYPSINSNVVDEEKIEQVLSTVLAGAITTNEEVDEFCVLPQEPAVENN